MATETEVKAVLVTLSGARLRNSPPAAEIGQVIGTWRKVFSETPGAILTTAADDFILTAEFWPTVAEFRRIVNQVENNHGRSKYADPSRERVGEIKYLDGEEVEVINPPGYCGVFRVTGAGWEAA